MFDLGQKRPYRILRLAAKRSLDVVMAAILLVLLSPLLAGLSLLLLVTQGRPILFHQERVGCRGRLFTLVKFRTMKPATGDRDPALDEQRLTPVGRHLRRMSLDELPQLWNILVGHMSLVGPRPLLPKYLPLYSRHQARRQEMRPGLTGWAQINGRTSLDWPKQFELDVWYVDNWSIALDVRIILKSAALIFTDTNPVPRGEFKG